MWNYFKESLHWLHLAFFKPITLEAESRRLSRMDALRTYLKVFPVGFVFSFLLLIVVGLLCEASGYPFNRDKALDAFLVVGLVFGLGGGLAGGQFHGLVGGLFGSLVYGLGMGLSVSLVVGLGGLGSVWGGVWGVGLSVGLIGGLGLGLVGGLVGGLGICLVTGLVSGLVLGLFFGLVGGLVGGFEYGLTEGLTLLLAYLPTFAFLFFRPFYLIPHLWQYGHALQAGDSFDLLRRSPVYWDEAIAMPLPYLSDWLVKLVGQDRECGLAEITFIAEKRPYQLRAAQKALLAVAALDLQRADTIDRMAGASETLKFIPAEREHLPKGLYEARDRIGKISTLSRDYLTRVTPAGRVKAIEEMRRELESFRDAMVFVKRPVGPSFQPIASRWLEIVKAVEAECRRQIAAAPLLNPFIAGNPLMARDNELFKGRRDIVVAIEERIINSGQRPALLLYGRRRIGKTSTLLNLPRLLGSEYAPVYIQCQEAKWQESDETFCYHLADEIFRALKDGRLSDGLERPQREKFEKYAFTELSGCLDEVEERSRKVGKRILLSFDEYEKLEEGIASARITKTVLNEIRSIVQHRERFAVLFSGSHRFDELKAVSWADYLINAQTIELSFLEPEDARELIERPTADFNLEYETGVVEKILEITHCQPYLVQSVGFELVNYLNSQQRLTASAGDLNVAVEKTLVSASGYFYYTWAEECSEDEREVLLAIVMNEAINPAEHRDSLRRLCQKEILERSGDQYRFTIELFRRWILKDQLAFERSEQLRELVFQT